MITPCVLMPRSVLQGIVASGQSEGPLVVRHRPAENLWVCTGAGNKYGKASESVSSFARIFKNLDSYATGGWFRADPECHELWQNAINRNQTVSMMNLRKHLKIKNKPLNFHNVDKSLMLTVVSDGDINLEVRAWFVDSKNALPYVVEEYDEDSDPFDILKLGWPLDELADKRITMVGLGSIGSAAFETLLSYGLRSFTLVDPQRLQQKNLSRHRLGREDIGRLKVAALKERFSELYPNADIDPLALSVEDSADVMRPLFRESDLILGAPDGVIPRRVVSHLARFAGIPSVLAAVLDEGRIGEVLRLRPDFALGCLTCQREHLEDSGAIVPEEHIHAGYPLATTEHPMTAVGGDLYLVGAFAAKIAVATILEKEGHIDQCLPGNHAIIGLRPASDLAEPFALKGPLEVKWHEGGPPREGCTTCFPER